MRFSIRAKLLGTLAIDLLLLVVLGYVAAQQMGVMHARASSVATHTIPSLTSVAALKTQLNEYRVNQLEYLLYSSSADKARSRDRMGEIEQRMQSQLVDYRPLINATSEGDHYAALERAWGALVAANHEHFLPDAAQYTTGSVRPFYSRMNPFYREVEHAIGDLADESRRQADADLAVVRGAYDTARNFIFFDTALTLLISATIGLLLAGGIARRIGRLTNAAGAVAAGELERRVEISSRDELGVLAAAFNRMVESLRLQRRALEERNNALAASLARQEQLTADLLVRRQAEEEAHRAQAAAEAASHAKSMFLATMSHELRTPLSAIIGYAQLMKVMGSELSMNKDVDPLEAIISAGRHLAGLISNVLDFSKMEQGKIDLLIEEVDIRTLVQDAVEVIVPLAQRQANELHVICPASLGTLTTDAGKVRQILINLLANAAKFTERGEITLRVWREQFIAGHFDDGRTSGLLPGIFFEVRDTGIGIAAEDIGRLFQPFSQLDSSLNRRYEGTGLGLALSRQLCHALGGEISVSSEPGKGSTFTLLLPIALAEEPKSPPPLMMAVAGGCSAAA